MIHLWFLSLLTVSASGKQDPVSCLGDLRGWKNIEVFYECESDGFYCGIRKTDCSDCGDKGFESKDISVYKRSGDFMFPVGLGGWNCTANCSDSSVRYGANITKKLSNCTVGP